MRPTELQGVDNNHRTHIPTISRDPHTQLPHGILPTYTCANHGNNLELHMTNHS